MNEERPIRNGQTGIKSTLREPVLKSATNGYIISPTSQSLQGRQNALHNLQITFGPSIGLVVKWPQMALVVLQSPLLGPKNGV